MAQADPVPWAEVGVEDEYLLHLVAMSTAVGLSTGNERSLSLLAPGGDALVGPHLGGRGPVPRRSKSAGSRVPQTALLVVLTSQRTPPGLVVGLYTLGSPGGSSQSSARAGLLTLTNVTCQLVQMFVVGCTCSEWVAGGGQNGASGVPSPASSRWPSRVMDQQAAVGDLGRGRPAVGVAGSGEDVALMALHGRRGIHRLLGISRFLYRRGSAGRPASPPRTGRRRSGSDGSRDSPRALAGARSRGRSRGRPALSCSHPMPVAAGPARTRGPQSHANDTPIREAAPITPSASPRSRTEPNRTIRYG
jgi:hypothetical protein